jgi:hypothetical protein
VIAEAFGLGTLADAAGDIQLTPDQVTPLSLRGREQRRVPLLEIDVDGAGRQVQGPYGMTLKERRLAHGHVVLEVGRASVVPTPGVVPETAVTTRVQQEASQFHVAPLGRLAVELDEGRFDERMSIGFGSPPWSEDAVDMVREADGDLE